PPPVEAPSLGGGPVSDAVPRPFPTEAEGERDERPRPGPHRLANAGVFYPLATNIGLPHLHTNLDVSLLFSRVGKVEGLQLGTVNYVSNEVMGLQVGLLLNAVEGDISGISLAGLSSLASGDLTGAQVSTLYN